MSNYGDRCRFNRDCGERMTMGEMVDKWIEALNRGGNNAFCDSVDDLFLNGCYGHDFDVLVERGSPREMRRDIRGALLAMYNAGRDSN